MGALSVGETITAYTDKIEDKDGLGELSYQWFNNAISINDATEKVYNLTVGDAGDDLSVIVKFLDEQGTEETITSFPVSINNATEQNGGIYTVNSSTFESPTIDFYLREEYDPDSDRLGY